VQGEGEETLPGEKAWGIISHGEIITGDRSMEKRKKMNKKSSRSSREFREAIAAKKAAEEKQQPQFLVPEVVDDQEHVFAPTLGMDSTSHSEISLMQNIQYAPQVIRRAHKHFDLNKLDHLKGKNRSTYLGEAKQQVTDLCNAIESMVAHTGMFVVHFLIDIGQILNHVDKTLDSKSDYSDWKSKNFGDRHTRYFQQARQLANMGSFAVDYASIGKNRLLELDRMKNAVHASSLNEIIARHPFPDTTEDMKEVLWKEHIDAVVTLYRLQEAEIGFAEFDQAALLACYNRHALEVKTVEKIQKFLERFPDRDAKKSAFEILVMDKMTFPRDGDQQITVSQESFDKILADLISHVERAKLSDKDKQKVYISRISEELFDRALKHMTTLSGMMKPKTKTKPKKVH